MRHDLRDERGFMNVLSMVGAVLAVAALLVPMFLWMRMQRDATEQASEAVGEARQVQAQLDLKNGTVAAQVHLTETGSFEGFTPEVASLIDPSTTYNASPTAVAHEVSVRSASAAGVVLVTLADDGTPLCAAVSLDGVRNGTTDAQTPEQCA